MRVAVLLAVALAGSAALPAAAAQPAPDAPPPPLAGPPGLPPGFPPGLAPPGFPPPGLPPQLRPPLTTSRDRYELQQTEGGFLRLDRDSGLTAFCSATGDGYACRPVAEGKTAQDAMIAKLEKRVAELEQKVKALSETKAAPAAAAPRDPTLDLPSDEQVDRVAGFLERALKRFRRLADDVQKDMGNDGKL